MQVVVALAVIALMLVTISYFFSAPRTAWGSELLDPACPRDHKAFALYGSSWVEEIRLRHSGNRIVHVFIPRRGEEPKGWPRLTGRTRPPQPDQDGETEIELAPR